MQDGELNLEKVIIGIKLNKRKQTKDTSKQYVNWQENLVDWALRHLTVRGQRHITNVGVK